MHLNLLIEHFLSRKTTIKSKFQYQDKFKPLEVYSDLIILCPLLYTVEIWGTHCTSNKVNSHEKQKELCSYESKKN